MSGRKTETLEAAYFDGLYAETPDPWAFETSPYERAKYARTLEVLAPLRARNALEVGCSIGVLTEQLAGVCEALLATDLSATALARARARCAGLPHVRFEQARAPTDLSPGPFDLILLSEVLYYFTPPDLALFAQGVHRALVPGGRVLAVHWLGETDYPLSGDEAVARFAGATPSLETRLAERTPDYRLDLWVMRRRARTAARSGAGGARPASRPRAR